MARNYLLAGLLLLKDLHSALQLLNRAALLLQQLLLRLVDLLLLQLRPDERKVVGQSPIELAVAIVQKEVQVRAHRRRARLVALRFRHAGSTAT